MARQKNKHQILKQQSMHHRASYAGQQKAQAQYRISTVETAAGDNLHPHNPPPILQKNTLKTIAPLQLETSEFLKKEAAIAEVVGPYVPMSLLGQEVSNRYSETLNCGTVNSTHEEEQPIIAPFFYWGRMTLRKAKPDPNCR